MPIDPKWIQTECDRQLYDAVIALQSASSLSHPYIDLRAAPYNIVAGTVSAAQALANAQAINQAILDYNGSGKALM